LLFSYLVVLPSAKRNEKNTKLQDLLSRLCALRAIDFDLKKVSVINDVGENVDLSKSVGECGLVFMEVIDLNEKDKDTKKEVVKFVNRGVKEGVQIKAGECCYLGLEEQLFDDEKRVLEEIKKKATDLCQNFSDEFIMSCLFSRKMDVPRTIELLKKSVQWRKENNFTEIPKFDDIPSQFWTLIHHIPCSRDKAGRSIRYTHPAAIHPNVHPWVPHTFKIALTWYHYVGMFTDGIDGIRNGFHVINNLDSLGWKNFDIDLQKHNAALVSETFPILIRRISILNPPAIFNALWKIMKIFAKKKIVDHLVVEKSIEREVDYNLLWNKRRWYGLSCGKMD